MTTKTFSFHSFVAGFLLGILLVGAWWFSGSEYSVSPAPSVPSSHPPSPEPAPESGAVSVVDQPAGATVVVESVTVPPPGVWVSVRETDGDQLGNVLGAVRVNGPRTAVSVPLLRPTEPGLSYAVELYRDDGNDVFDLSSDSVYVDFTTGAPVITRFTTTQ